MGFGVWGLGFQVSGFRFRVSGSGLRVSGFGIQVSGFGFRDLNLPVLIPVVELEVDRVEERVVRHPRRIHL